MSGFALTVELIAKPGKEAALAAFLASAEPLAAAEPNTQTWFAVRIDDSRFGIFDTFATEAGRDEHLGGAIAAALMAHADELLSAPPQIRKADILAQKLPRP